MSSPNPCSTEFQVEGSRDFRGPGSSLDWGTVEGGGAQKPVCYSFQQALPLGEVSRARSWAAHSGHGLLGIVDLQPG